MIKDDVPCVLTLTFRGRILGESAVCEYEQEAELCQSVQTCHFIDRW